MRIGIMGLAISSLCACAGAPPTAPTPRTEIAADVAPTLTIRCADDASTITETLTLPPLDERARGDVVRCWKVKHLSPEDMNRILSARGYQHVKPETGATMFRVVYRARRDGAARQPDGLSAALLFLPDRPRVANTTIVFAHGTVGLADRCGQSREEPLPIHVAFAGAGWITIAPDYSGFGYHQPPQGWMSGEDEARSLFDGARAVQKAIAPAFRPTQVVLVGHSEGGHAVLAAQALAPADGFDVPIAGVVATAPMWFSGRLFSSMLGDPAATQGSGKRDLSWSLFYFFGHGELMDAPGHGLSMIREDKRKQVETWLTTQCANDLDKPLDGVRAADLYDPGFVSALDACARGTVCSGDTKGWVDKMRRDWMPLDPHGAPVLFVQGGRDPNVTPTRARCGLNQLERTLDAKHLKVCVDKDATHRGIPDGMLERNTNLVLQWVAARAVGDPEPTCEGEPALEAQGKLTCPTTGDD